jgi:hypothetical protein
VPNELTAFEKLSPEISTSADGQPADGLALRTADPKQSSTLHQTLDGRYSGIKKLELEERSDRFSSTHRKLL